MQVLITVREDASKSSQNLSHFRVLRSPELALFRRQVKAKLEIDHASRARLPFQPFTLTSLLTPAHDTSITATSLDSTLDYGDSAKLLRETTS